MTCPELDLQLVKKLSKNESPAGLCNLFLLINEDWGIKFCQSMYIRDIVYDRQKRAAEHGLGPVVGNKVDLPKVMHFTDDFGHSVSYKHGYFTERVDVVGRNEKLQNEKDRDILICELWEKIRFSFIDCHWRNVGIKNGELVCIDFD